MILKEAMLGATCMKWTVKGNGYEKGSYVEDFGTGDHNYCRLYYQKIFEG